MANVHTVGTPESYRAFTDGDLQQTLATLENYVNQLQQHNIPFSSAAGNDAHMKGVNIRTDGWPGQILMRHPIIHVGASTKQHMRWARSRLSKIGLYAPGEDIAMSDGIRRSVVASGSSAATIIVSGIMVIWSAISSPFLFYLARLIAEGRFSQGMIDLLGDEAYKRSEAAGAVEVAYNAVMHSKIVEKTGHAYTRRSVDDPSN